jgi:hypothetical protein
VLAVQAREVLNFVDALGHHQAGALGPLREKVAHGTADGPGHAHRLVVFVEEREVPVARSEAIGVVRREGVSGICRRATQKDVLGRVQEVDETFDVRA